jgi:hydroxymethylglutaryl-CoA synthase
MRHLNRAVKFTGQKAIRFTSPWEDSVTMAAEAARKVLKNSPPFEAAKVRYIAAGTETGVDHSKPLSSFVQGLLQESGIPLSRNLSSFQVQHACAGGTLALLNVAAMLSANRGAPESGLVVASDIARYETESTAELTQGAGAAALLVENNPRLLELDLSTVGYCSRNVDDFFRPIGSRIARVRGRYSMDCYIDNFKEAVRDHCTRRGITVPELLSETDFFALHTPFTTMPERAMQEILKEYMGLVNGQTEAFLASHGFYTGTAAIARIGNTYSASLYIVLAHLLEAQYKVLGDEIIGKKAMLASYGSGNTMVVLSARVAEGAPMVIRDWNLRQEREKAIDAPLMEYEEWTKGPSARESYNALVDRLMIPENSCFLSQVREDGYREYGIKTAKADRIGRSQTSGVLLEPAPIGEAR